MAGIAEDVLRRLEQAQQFLVQTAPNLKIEFSRGRIRVGIARLVKSFACSALFLFLYPDELLACKELFWDTVKEHSSGKGFDIKLFDKQTQQYIIKLPRHNVFMGRRRAQALWTAHSDFLEPLEWALNKSGIRLSQECRERLQIHCCLINK